MILIISSQEIQGESPPAKALIVSKHPGQIKLWNQLSSDVKLAPSLAAFKRRLKKEILEG